MNTYELNAVCVCPADKKPDSYSVRIESRRMIWTNEIGDAVEVLSQEAMAQEEFTWKLHRLLKAKVITIGTHPSFQEEGVCSKIKLICVEGEA